QAYYHSAAVLNVLRALDQCGYSDLAEPGGEEPARSLHTSHEALILPYEEALTRWDTGSAAWYGTSAHLLWVGERTRKLDQAHIEFAAGLANPIAVKLGPTTTKEYVLALCQRLNPARLAGRLTLIPRMGASQVRAVLPELVRAVQDAG